MLGEKALELVKELQRSRSGTLPPFNVRHMITHDTSKVASRAASFDYFMNRLIDINNRLLSINRINK